MILNGSNEIKIIVVINNLILIVLNDELKLIILKLKSVISKQ